MTTESTHEAIELRVNEVAQLFHTLDPFPFRERDLDREAEEFIVGWARELPIDQPIRIVVHFPDSDLQTKAAKELSEAFARYFSYRADTLQRDLNELFRVGRRSLAIGVLVLLACFAAAHLAGGYLTETPFKRIGRGELPNSRLGRKLAPARNLSVRLVAHCTSAPNVPPPFQSNRGSQAILSRTVAHRCRWPT